MLLQLILQFCTTVHTEVNFSNPSVDVNRQKCTRTITQCYNYKKRDHLQSEEVLNICISEYRP